ncbi:NAD(P)-binding protein [Metschnikowia bicuspidata]|uniref:NAD(P)-binding protein n=1 Tax=Metschnikowia bicuspidata TaxID=27322 RepID=A0A4P9Z981_9ASCO|nr:NAD(P)-binding protein [Metschnikowia bicuspidata]
MNSIAVFGGNGFLGRKICEVGVRIGWSVTSLSRSGSAPRPLPNYDNSWMEKVAWQKADLFEPESYKQHLAGKTAVVHSVGILFENSGYKKALNGAGNIASVARALTGPNPMERTPKNTYAAIQRDSALAAADTFLDVATPEQKPAFVYISADSSPPGIIPSGYLSTKREAEYQLAQKLNLRSIFMRPAFLYDPNERLSVRNVLGCVVNVQNAILERSNSIKLIPFGLDSLFRPAVTTEQVATTMYRKLEEGFRGIVPLEEIRKATR